MKPDDLPELELVALAKRASESQILDSARRLLARARDAQDLREREALVRRLYGQEILERAKKG